jgi:SAM-dependent methyltransferase
MDARRFAPATARNREPILAVLARVVPEGARVLEVAAGSGEHACFLAERLPVAEWQPTDPDAESRASIDAWRAHAGSGRVKPALALDVTSVPWPVDDERADVVVCINMVHISPWEATLALLRGAARALATGGVLFLYGPYQRDGAHTAESNAEFDASLRARNPAWGVRDLGDVTREAEQRGFSLEEVVAMPANNFCVLLRRA